MHSRSTILTSFRTVVSLALLLVLLTLFGHKVHAHVAVPGDATADSIQHALGNLGSSPPQYKRWWADAPYCYTEIDRINLPDGPGGTLRALYRFRVYVNGNARGHAMEAGAFSDSTQPWCDDTQGSAWNGTRVNVDDDFFKVGGRKPIRATLGVQGGADETAPGVRRTVPEYPFDWLLRLGVGIRSSTEGGAYGWNGDAAGYKINGTTVWCAGLDIGGISDPFNGVSTNVRWPGWYWGNCAGGSFLFNEFNGNYDTHWGAYTIGAMKEGLTDSGVRCGGCALGSNIPGMSTGADGTINDFDLEVAGIKNHDGVGTYNGGVGVPPGFGGSADAAALARGNPYPIGGAEAWITMEWDPSSRGGIQVTKYPGSSGPDANGHPTGPWAAPASTIGSRNICILPAVGCNNGNPMGVFSAPNALPGGIYQVDANPPPGYRVKEVRAQYGGFLGLDYFTIDDPDGDGRYQADIGVGFGVDNTLYFDIYYEPEVVDALSCSVSVNPSIPEPGQSFRVNINYAWSGGSPVDPTAILAIRPEGSSTSVITRFGIDFGPPATSGSTTEGLFTLPMDEYEVRVRVAISPSNFADCEIDLPVAAKPYVKFYGNDVMAGGAFADSNNSCGGPYNPNASIRSLYDQDRNDRYVGSSAQLAASALGVVQDFFSAGQRNAPAAPPNPLTDLTFGNYDGTRLGSFVNNPGDSGIWRCIPDYFSTASPSQIENGNRTIGGPQAQQVRYIDGDVYINSDITMSDFATVGGIRPFYLVVRGNIYIDNNSVDRLDGVYIAQPHPSSPNSTGTIYTCALARASLPTPSQLYASCDTKLTVNGAFIARRVKLLRTYETMRNSDANEGPDTNNAAEEFNFLPELYLDSPLGNESSVGTKYDFITSLPPIL